MAVSVVNLIEWGPVADPLFIAIIDAYYRPAWLRHAAEALLGQTYANLDLVLVDNGGTPETKACLKELKAADPLVKLVEFARPAKKRRS